MVSRYRDILEPPSTPSPFFDTTTAGGKNKGISISLFINVFRIILFCTLMGFKLQMMGVVWDKLVKNFVRRRMEGRAIVETVVWVETLPLVKSLLYMRRARRGNCGTAFIDRITSILLMLEFWFADNSRLLYVFLYWKFAAHCCSGLCSIFRIGAFQVVYLKQVNGERILQISCRKLWKQQHHCCAKY